MYWFQLSVCVLVVLVKKQLLVVHSKRRNETPLQGICKTGIIHHIYTHPINRSPLMPPAFFRLWRPTPSSADVPWCGCSWLRVVFAVAGDALACAVPSRYGAGVLACWRAVAVGRWCGSVCLCVGPENPTEPIGPIGPVGRAGRTPLRCP